MPPEGFFEGLQSGEYLSEPEKVSRRVISKYLIIKGESMLCGF